MVRKKTIYKVIKYGMIIIACIIAFKTIFHDFKLEYLISWNAFSNWWIDTYVGLFTFLFSDIIQNHRYFHELWRSENTITQFEEV